MASSPGLIFFFTRSLAAHFGCRVYISAGSLYARSFLLPPVLSISSLFFFFFFFSPLAQRRKHVPPPPPPPTPISFPLRSRRYPSSSRHQTATTVPARLSTQPQLHRPRRFFRSSVRSRPVSISRSMFSMMASGKLFSSYSFFRFVDVIPSSSSSSVSSSLSFVVF